MFRVHNENIPISFLNKFHYIEHRYPTRHSENNFVIPKTNLRITNYAISSRGPRIWNGLTDYQTKSFTFHPLFKKKIKENLLKLPNELDYF